MKCVASIAEPFAFRCSLLEFRHVSSMDTLLINFTPCLEDTDWTFSLINLQA